MTPAAHLPFLNLHNGSEPLVIPNAWDAASAALFQQAGAPAVATSSAAMAWSLGYPDGGALPRHELLAAIGRIQRVLRVPLSVDLEDGYSDTPESVAALVAEVSAMGVTGINLEDGEKAPSLLADKIAACRQALGAAPLFINARTDVVLRGLASDGASLDMTLQRAGVYHAAGADGLFVPGMISLADTQHIASQTELPLNLMLLPGMPSIPALFAQGARRFTAGPANFQSAYGTLQAAAQALVQGHDTSGLFANAVAYDTMNALFT